METKISQSDTQESTKGQGEGDYRGWGEAVFMVVGSQVDGRCERITEEGMGDPSLGLLTGFTVYTPTCFIGRVRSLTPSTENTQSPPAHWDKT